MANFDFWKSVFPYDFGGYGISFHGGESVGFSGRVVNYF